MKNPTITGVELYEYARQNCTAFNGFPSDGSEGYIHEPERTFFYKWLKPGIAQVAVPARFRGRHDIFYIPVRFPDNTEEK